MCGFLGLVDYDSVPVKERCLKGLSTLSHRGPDADDYFLSGNVFLGHQRLSIIDLSNAAKQPMTSSSGSCHIIFNGEIYNYSDLKKEFSYTDFKSTSDTEIILEGYLKEGVDFFKKLRGIYAFAIYDEQKKNMLITRDPSGIKPLYFYNKNDHYAFSSEIKGLIPLIKENLTINDQVIKTYLNIGYCPEPFTVYNEIKAVEPGTCYEININGVNKTEIISYNYKPDKGNSGKEYISKVKDLLINSVKRNLTADVKVAVALSGGIDSSLIYAYALKENPDLQAISVSFNDEKFDESNIARKFADAVNGKLQVVDIQKDFNLKLLNRILLQFDQPYSDTSAIPTYFLTKAAREHTKVLIGGDGGDELFNGYPSQMWVHYLYRIKKFSTWGTKAIEKLGKKITPLLKGTKRRELQRMLNMLKGSSPIDLLYDWHSWIPRKTIFHGGSPFKFDPDDGIKLYQSLFPEESPENFDEQIVFDYFRKRMLSDYLRKTDMMSMMNSLEYRVPMLDEDLASYALQIPFKKKADLKKTKKILRDIHGEIYPAELSMLPKKGFTIPLDKNLTTEEFQEIRNVLLDTTNNILLEYVKKEYIEFLFIALENPKKYSHTISRWGIYQRIVMFYSLQLWYKNYLKDNHSE